MNRSSKGRPAFAARPHHTSPHAMRIPLDIFHSYARRVPARALVARVPRASFSHIPAHQRSVRGVDYTSIEARSRPRPRRVANALFWASLRMKNENTPMSRAIFDFVRVATHAIKMKRTRSRITEAGADETNCSSHRVGRAKGSAARGEAPSAPTQKAAGAGRPGRRLGLRRS